MPDSSVWQNPQRNLILTDDIIHIWRANLNLPEAEITRLEAILAPDERSRADRFRFPEHRNRFIAARGILRELLANYLNVSSRSLKFTYGLCGKPELLDYSLNFNVSHSQDLALYGISKNSKIGVDLEYLRNIADFLKIARRFFSPQEAQWLYSLKESERKLGFFQLWTAKEAYLKATGEGLSGALDKVEISIAQPLSVNILAIKGDTKAAEQWLMTPLVLATDCVATVAIENPHRKRQIEFLSWK